MRVTSAHIRAARGLLGWSISELAERSGVSRNTITNMEARGVKRSAATLLVVRTLEAAGIEFMDDPGVKLKRAGQ